MRRAPRVVENSRRKVEEHIEPVRRRGYGEFRLFRQRLVAHLPVCAYLERAPIESLEEEIRWAYEDS